MFYLYADKTEAYVGDSVTIMAYYRVTTDGKPNNSNITSFNNVELTSTSGSLNQASNKQSYTLTKPTAGTVTVYGTWDGSIMGLQEMEGTQTAEIKVEFIQDTPSRNPVDILFRIDVSSYGTSEESNRYVVNSYEYSS